MDCESAAEPRNASGSAVSVRYDAGRLSGRQPGCLGTEIRDRALKLQQPLWKEELWRGCCLFHDFQTIFQKKIRLSHTKVAGQKTLTCAILSEIKKGD